MIEEKIFTLISNLFSKHNTLTFHNLVNHNELTFMHKYVNNMLPISFNERFVKSTIVMVGWEAREQTPYYFYTYPVRYLLYKSIIR